MQANIGHSRIFIFSFPERGTHNLDIEGSSGPSTPTITASGTSSSGPAAGSTRSNSISVPDSGGSASGANSASGTPSSKNLNTEGLAEGWTMQVAPNGRVRF